MVDIQILKNGNVIKKISCPKIFLQKYFEVAMDIAGGMYNGTDEFTVKIVEL
jgi:hypothetical protein